MRLELANALKGEIKWVWLRVVSLKNCDCKDLLDWFHTIAGHPSTRVSWHETTELCHLTSFRSPWRDKGLIRAIEVVE